MGGSTVDPGICEHGCASWPSGTGFWKARSGHWKPQGTSAGSPASRSDVVFTLVTTHSFGREKVTVSRLCGHERLNCGLQKPCDTSYYMLSEPYRVARPFSRTAVHQVPPLTVSATYRESTREPLRAGKSAAEVVPGVCKPGHAP